MMTDFAQLSNPTPDVPAPFDALAALTQRMADIYRQGRDIRAGQTALVDMAATMRAE